MVIQEVTPEFVPWAKIKVIWVWWAWWKAVNRMITEGLEWVEFVAVNTDAQDLANNLAEKKINIWLNLTRWLWAWAKPEVGRKAAEESESEIRNVLQDADMVFITCWMWGWTWTWAAPVVAQIAKELWILVIWIITKPFSFEWKRRLTNSEEGTSKMKDSVDTLITIPNDKIFTVIDKKTTFKQAFTMIDKILFLWVQWISDLIVKPWDINIDFADIKVIMENSWNALLWIWYWAGENRAVDAARQAIENPLLDTHLDWAKNVIFAVAWWYDLTPIEVQEAANVIESIIDSDNVNLIRWMTFDESYEDEVKVTLIATWFEETKTDDILKKPNRDILWRKTMWNRNNFVSRWVRDVMNNSSENNINEDYLENTQEDKENLETPAFIRKRLWNN